MLIQVNTNNHITGSAELSAEVEATVENTLGRLAEQITRVEVHIADENAGKGGDDDIRCTMEARVEGRPPLATSNRAGTVSEAVAGAADKLKSAVEKDLGKLQSF